MLLFLYEAISTFGGTSLCNPSACLALWKVWTQESFPCLVLWWWFWWSRGDGVGSVSSHGRGVLMLPRYSQPVKPHGRGGRSLLMESLCEQITFVCQAFTSAYRENLTRFEDLLRLWLKTSPMMPCARVWTVNTKNRMKYILIYIIFICIQVFRWRIRRFI